MTDIDKKKRIMKKSFHSDTKRTKQFYKIDLTLILLIVTVFSISFSIIYSISPEDYDQVDHTHTGLECSSCHDPDTYDLLKEPNVLCLDCHTTDGVMPIEEGHGFGMECSTCHTIATPVETDNGEEVSTQTHPQIAEGTDCASCHDISITAHSSCLSCHDIESESVLISQETGEAITDTSILCSQCHSNEYSEWEEGIHVNNEDSLACVDCHDPHQPYVIIEETLPPVYTMAGENEVSGPIIPPVLFFAAIIVALCAVVYMFYYRRA